MKNNNNDDNRKNRIMDERILSCRNDGTYKLLGIIIMYSYNIGLWTVARDFGYPDFSRRVLYADHVRFDSCHNLEGPATDALIRIDGVI